MDWQSQEAANALVVALGNRFDIVNRLGVGGQGVVFRATRRNDPQGAKVSDDVALKVHTNSAEARRVDREVEALRGFDHPCLASFLEHGLIQIGNEKIRFIAWRFIEGSSLDSRLKKGPVSHGTVTCIGRDVARALDHIWQKRIVHRDVNPKNIMLLPREDSAVLIDLGVARFLDQSALTASGRTWGTPGYFSPEQWTGPGENLTCYSDVFALGITLQEALLGTPPTGGDQMLLLTSPVPTGKLCPIAPAGLVSIIDRCLMLRPSFRPTPAVLSQELAALAHKLA